MLRDRRELASEKRGRAIPLPRMITARTFIPKAMSGGRLVDEDILVGGVAISKFTKRELLEQLRQRGFELPAVGIRAYTKKDLAQALRGHIMQGQPARAPRARGPSPSALGDRPGVHSVGFEALGADGKRYRVAQKSTGAHYWKRVKRGERVVEEEEVEQGYEPPQEEYQTPEKTEPEVSNARRLISKIAHQREEVLGNVSRPGRVPARVKRQLGRPRKSSKEELLDTIVGDVPVAVAQKVPRVHKLATEEYLPVPKQHKATRGHISFPEYLPAPMKHKATHGHIAFPKHKFTEQLFPSVPPPIAQRTNVVVPGRFVGKVPKKQHKKKQYKSKMT